MRITFRDPLSQNTANEGTAFAITAKFWDDTTDAWASYTPTSISYRIDDSNGRNTLGWTTVSPAASVTLTATVTANTLIDQMQDRELRVMTVKVNDGLSTQYTDTYSWYVRNTVAM